MNPIISHEVPLAYLEYSKQFNDYDYALVHLFDENPEYFNFFKKSLKEGRRVLLDNSAYEITTNPDLLKKYPQGYYPVDKYIEWIKKLQPTEFVLPDVKDNCEETMYAVECFIHDLPDDIKSKKIGVVHGRTFYEMNVCYSFMKQYCDKIAFSYESWWFDWAKKFNIPIERIRYEMINTVQIDENMPHHLLGCILPQEFACWTKENWIESIDTSAPITNAIDITVLNPVMLDKPKTTIHGSFKLAYSENIASLMKLNAGRFREFYIDNPEKYVHKQN